MLVRPLRAMLALLVIALGLVITLEAPAFACSCARQGVPKLVERADVVFVATVDEVTPDSEAMFVYDLTATRAYKGEVDRQTSLTSSRQTSACGLGELTVGKDYLFFGQGAAAPYAANTCNGTGAANPARVSAVELVAGEGTPIEPPPPPTAQRTLVEDSPPLGFARTAAPGAAAVLIGLLGLVVVRRLARRA